MQQQTLRDLDIKGKRVLIRVDFNVPLNAKQEITDDARIVKSLATLRYCLGQNAKVILMSHLGRPDGKRDLRFSLRPVAERLSKLLHKKIDLAEDCVGPAVQNRVNKLQNGEALLLENLRFHAEEEKNDLSFAKQLASLADIYVNDAFGAAHRAHASTVGVAQFLPSAAGFLLAKEIEYFEKAVTNPDRPFVTLLGGSKVSDKIKLISNLLDKADTILIGGAMAYTFLKVKGIPIGVSRLDKQGETAAKEALAKSQSKNVPLILPEDHVVAEKLEKGVASKIVAEIPEGWMGLDIGPKTAERFKSILNKAKTILWNGPVGVFEMPPFDQGTRALADCLSKLRGATTIIGGGDTAAAVAAFGLEDKMTHVSTGGGASLEYLEGRVLPGVAALANKAVAGRAS